ncbi:Scr1 family TA system antitoxin-like transcriptional regulator [Yinghuangia seranimata]|uniref:Scr1 family TA system antitoxin-like transcriptional regulator n=1 Tax=Yinghuangia seranimata TaxID=408067 RepID=UPI00248B6809|nr:Scr1 family TA system antitoxin-like transcriptional regulator [Yinghuangia seranimata]MDI2127162.1 Scr1 family TA system antitoxin-like transcriptional regulator [Yinghuangia seranimata]
MIIQEWYDEEKEGLAPSQREVLPRFERTRELRAYSDIIPGLLQTGPYIEAILANVQTERRDYGIRDVAEAVQARLERARLLDAPDKSFSYLLEEVGLYAAICDRKTLLDQFEALKAGMERPNVDVGIIPQGTGRRSTISESFHLFDDACVSVELIAFYLMFDEPEKISAYRQQFEAYSAMAVRGNEALALIDKAAAVLGGV